MTRTRYEDDPYCQSFLLHCDAEGNAPEWAIKAIFKEHGSDLSDYYACNKGYAREKGTHILNWLGY